MLIAYTGDRGSGKTLSMVAQAYTDFKTAKKKILSNMEGLTFPCETITKEDLIGFAQKDNPLHNCVILLDELHNLVDARRSMSKNNLILSYLILQSRKRDVDVYFTTQEFEQVDKRMRQQTDLQIYCESEKIKNKDGVEIILIDQVISSKYNVINRLIVGNPVFPLYDTAEVISIV